MKKTFLRPSPQEPRPFDRKEIDRTERIKSTVIIAATIGFCLILSGILTFTIIMAWISRDLPKPNALILRDLPQSTKIFDRTGTTTLYEIHGDQKRSLVRIEDIPDVVKQSTIALEDRTFYEHKGINWISILRAVYVDIIEHRKAQGASTLTQQLVKNAVLTNEKSFTRKLKEMLLAMQIERRFTKDQILQMYLNEIPYGNMIYGIGSAAENYFGKPVTDLTLDEAALLAAIPQAPDRYSPYGNGIHGDNRQQLVSRQHYTLDTMVRDGYITKEQAEEAKKVDTLTKIKPRAIGNIRAPHFVMYVKSKLIETYGQKMVEQGGLRVITTMDLDKQQIAEEEVKNGVEKNGKKFEFTNAALVALDPKSGQVLSMVGSKDFFDETIDGQVNVAISPRQPGSSFKPIVYAAGFIKGYTPETTIWDASTTFATEMGPYKPVNYHPEYNGPVTIRKALQGSLNIPAVKMLYLVGISRVLDFAEQLGYTTFAERSRFGLSLVLGGGEVKLLEHVNAYAAMANNGKQYPIATILKVTDPDGKVLEEWKDAEDRQVMPSDVAQRITDILSDNDARAYIFGTSNYLTVPGRVAAAKTGTTNNFKDAWTIGYTPNLATGVWVGNSDGKEMKKGADGSMIAAPIWQAYMKRALAGTPKESFTEPPPVETTKPVLIGESFKQEIAIDKITGKLATENTPPEMVEKKTFYEGHDILYYVDKDDPLGPEPKNPEQDPQFANWEKGVQAWIKQNNWYTTSTPPTETDDVHTPANKPTITILAPQNNETLNTREAELRVSATAPRTVNRIEATIAGLPVGQIYGNEGILKIRIPNAVEKGYRDITVTAYDDVGNKASATVTVNLLADPTASIASISAPSHNSHVKRETFPIKITIILDDPSNTKKLSVRYQLNDTNNLIGTIIAPTTAINIMDWNTPPEAGSLLLTPIITTADNTEKTGESIRLIVDP